MLRIPMIGDFVISFLASLAATALILLTVTWRSKLVRRALTALASAFLGVEIRYVFSDGKRAENGVKDALKKAKNVRIFTGRGNAFQRDLYETVLKNTSGTDLVVHVLLPDPNEKRQGVDWVSSREEELAKFDTAFGGGTLRRQIQATCDYLEPFISPGCFEVRLYHAPHIGRIILTDDYLFLTPYSASRHGRDCHVFEYGRGEMYDMFSRFFEMIWEDSESRALPSH